MVNSYDVAIAGLGAMGSAAAAAMARRGGRVIGFDRFTPPHTLGSSHGESRIIREAYFEQPLYVPLVRRAYARWQEIEQRTGVQLLVISGGLTMGPADCSIVSGARASVRMHQVLHEELSAAEVNRRFPAWRLPDDVIGIWEPRAGVLFPERCIETFLADASAQGATLAFDEPVIAWMAIGDGDGVEVRTTKGVYHAGRLVLAAGGWMRELARDLDLPLAVERNVLHWFQPARAAETFEPDRFPVFLLECAPGRIGYGFPNLGGGVKVAWHHGGAAVADATTADATTADSVRRTVDASEIDGMRAFVRRYLPDADGPHLESAVCHYTNTPDLDFIIDRHPAHPQVVIASPCSGHGFKFSSAIGDILADLAMDGASDFDLAPFRLTRFGARTADRE